LSRDEENKRLEEDRYSRQILFEPIGIEGQKRIREAKALVLGCGGLGAASAEMLARAGIGFLRIVDRDVVEISNLQRQSLFSESDASGRVPKSKAAARRIAEINSGARVEAIVADAGPHNILDFLDGVDFAVDGLDNFEGRYLLNDACVKLGVPWAYGGAVGSYGLTAFIVPRRTPCLRCLFTEPPEMGVAPTCDTAGVISPVLHVIASLQVAAALKWLVEGAPPPRPALTSVDVWEGRFESLAVNYETAGKGCPCCAKGEYEFLESARAHTTTLCGRNSVQVCPQGGAAAPDFDSIALRLRNLGEVETGDYLLFFKAEGHEMLLFGDGRAIVKGTNDPARARTLVARYFGT
jgi:adenylyltransferase/sulfurtransferase